MVYTRCSIHWKKAKKTEDKNEKDCKSYFILSISNKQIQLLYTAKVYRAKVEYARAYGIYRYTICSSVLNLCPVNFWRTKGLDFGGVC